MSLLSRLAGHSARYAIASVFVIVGSLLSFPILTRMLSVEEYGVMSLIASMLTMVIAAGKLGLQHSTLRFYGEYLGASSQTQIDRFVSTSVFGMALLGISAMLVYLAVTQGLPSTSWSYPNTAALMRVPAILVFARMMESAFFNLLRAEERSGALSIASVLRKYLEIGAVLLTLFFIERSLWGFYFAQVTAEVTWIVLFVGLNWRGRNIRVSQFSSPLFMQLLVFGVPMLGYEVVTMGSVLGDRYLIQTMLGADDLGIYSAAYNLADSIKTASFAALLAAVVPIYTKMFAQSGAQATTEFLKRFLHMYALVTVAIVVPLAAAGSDLLIVLASRRYEAAGAILPVVVFAFALDNAGIILGAGLYLGKKTKTLLALLIVTTILKISLTALLVKPFGPIGAATSSIVASAVMLAALALAGRKHLKIEVPWSAFFKFGVLGMGVLIVIHELHSENVFISLALRMFAGIALLLPAFAATDRDFRQVLQSGFKRLRAML